jgi:DNA-binding Xre family transcriptional regulator
MGVLATKLEKIGGKARSKSAIKQRAYAYEILLENRRISCVSDQVAIVYEMLRRENDQKAKGIKSYIREVYRPQESLEALEDTNLLSNLTGESRDLLEMKRTIDYKSTFPMVLQKYVDLKGIKKHSSMCKRIGMKPDTFSAILRGKYKEVKKENVLRICVGLELRVKEAEELLKSAGLAFSDGDMTDVVVKAFLWDGIYSVVAINAELYENDEAMLFENYAIEYEV